MDSVIRSESALANFANSKQTHKPRPFLLRQFFDGLRVLFEQGVVRGGVGQARLHGPQVFVPDRREEDEARVFPDGIHQLGHLLFEAPDGIRLAAVARLVAVERDVLRAVGHFLQARGHAVGEEDDGGFDHGDAFLQPLPAFVRPVEAGAGDAVRRVAGPGEIAHGEVAVGELLVHPRFEIAVGVLAFEEGVAEEEDAVAFHDLEGRGVGGAEGREEEDEQEGEEAGAHGSEGS